MQEYTTTIGLDLGDRSSHFCVVDEKGEVKKQGRVRTTRKGMDRRFSCWSPSRIVMEVGTHSGWVSGFLGGLDICSANGQGQSPRSTLILGGTPYFTDMRKS